jgi:hypothetical protein
MKAIKTKKIIIKQNGKEIEESKSNWISVDWISVTESLFYLSWKDGRIYFFIPLKNNNETIKDLFVGNNCIRFRYEGEWELEVPEYHRELVSYNFEIEFKNFKEFNKVASYF